MYFYVVCFCDPDSESKTKVKIEKQKVSSETVLNFEIAENSGLAIQFIPLK